MKKTGFVTKYYDNIRPTDVVATNTCAYCGEEFTEANPCWNSDGSSEDNELHIDGECKTCATKIKDKIKAFEQARANFYDAAVTLLTTWQIAEAAQNEPMFERNYPFDEDFDTVVYKIGRWSTDDPHDFEADNDYGDDDPEAWELEDNNEELPEQGEPNVD